MKILKSLLCVALLSVTVYSCAPEDLPDNSPAKADNITAETGDQADEIIERKRDESEAQSKTMGTGDQLDELVPPKRDKSDKKRN